MANTFKYNVSTETEALKKGNFWIGANDVPKPTDTTGFWHGITPPLSGYTIYLNKVSNGPAIYVASDNSELVSLTNRIAGATFTSATQTFNYYSTQSDKMVLNRDYGPIVTNGLLSAYDFGFIPSYPQSGNTLYDISYSGANMTLYNSPQYTSQYGGGISLDNIDDYIRVIGLDLNGLALSKNFTVGIWCIKEFYGTGGNNVGNSNLLTGASNGYNNGWRIIEYSTGTVGTPFSGRHSFSLGIPTISNSLYVTDGAAIYRAVYIVVSVTSGTTFMYCNGGYVSGDTGTYISGDTYGYIGTGDYGVGRWGGKIFNAQIYNRGLSLDEVKQNYLAYINRFTGADIVTRNLVLNVDAGYRGSYPTSGTTFADISGNNFNGTLTNGPTFNSSNGGSIALDGTNDWISFGQNNSYIMRQDYTMSIWFKLDFSAKTDEFIILNGVGTINGGQLNYCLRRLSNTYRWYLSDGTTLYTVDANYTLGTTITNIVCTFARGGNAVIYINGEQFTSQSAPYSTYNGTQNRLAISGLANGGVSIYYLTGNVYNFSLYNRALSASEVLQNYYAKLPQILGENIVTENLNLYLDAGYTTSYPTTGTTWYDVSGYGLDGSLINGPTYSSSNGGVIDFDGTDDFVSCNNILNFTYSNPFTTEAWINWDGGVQPNNAGHIIGKTFGNYRTFLLTNTNPGTISFRLGLNIQTTNTTAIISPNTWYHVVSTWDPTTFIARVYINGIERASTKNTNNTWTYQGANFQIGNSPGENYYFNGKIPIGRVYSQTLSSVEVLQNFNAQKSRFGL
jgi:hypothetical protein